MLFLLLLAALLDLVPVIKGGKTASVIKAQSDFFEIKKRADDSHPPEGSVFIIALKREITRF